MKKLEGEEKKRKHQRALVEGSRTICFLFFLPKGIRRVGPLQRVNFRYMMIYAGYVHPMAVHEIKICLWLQLLGSFSASVQPPGSMLDLDFSLRSKQKKNTGVW